MNKLQRLSFLIICTLVFGCWANAQVDPKAVAAVSGRSIVVVNEAGRESKFNAVDLAKLKRVTVKAVDHGKDTVFEGVALFDVLVLAGVEFGEKLRGKRLASYLLAEAADKYRAVFALPELDPGFTDKTIILADRRDGKPLAENAGDWQIVVPDEKRPARWVRQIVSLKIVGPAN